MSPISRGTHTCRVVTLRGMDGYRVEGSEITFEGAIARVRMDRVRMPDGQVVQREIIERPDAVAVVPVDDEGRVVLLRQYRQALGARVLELPAGILDVEGESPRAAAARELVEEVGLAAGELTELVRFANSAGWATEHTTIYLGTGLREASAEGFTAVEEEADLEVLRLPLETAVAMAERGEVHDAKTLVGLLMAKSHLVAR